MPICKRKIYKPYNCTIYNFLIENAILHDVGRWQKWFLKTLEGVFGVWFLGIKNFDRKKGFPDLNYYLWRYNVVWCFIIFVLPSFVFVKRLIVNWNCKLKDEKRYSLSVATDANNNCIIDAKLEQYPLYSQSRSVRIIAVDARAETSASVWTSNSTIRSQGIWWRRRFRQY